MTTWDSFGDSANSSDSELLAYIEKLRGEIRQSITALLDSPNVPEEIKQQLREARSAEQDLH